MSRNLKDGVFYYGDNLPVLRDLPDESVDLIYLDPPFNSNVNYNAVFKDESGQRTDAQVKAFDDTWRWGATAEEHYSFLTNTSVHNGRVGEQVTGMIAALVGSLGKGSTAAYLVEMTVRLVELRRVLKETGSLYLHCDTSAGSYLKVILDMIFGSENARNEIIWHYGGRGGKAISGQFPRNHDIILAYSKADGKQLFNRQYQVRKFTPVEASEKGFRQDEDGRWFKTSPRGNYTDESVAKLEKEGRIHRTKTGSVRIKYFLKVVDGLIEEEVVVGDVWNDIPDAMHIGKEFLGYPTQKPLALLERIISASSNPGDIVLDPFCGCGTAVAAAQKLGRRWIGIDLTYLSIAVMKRRMLDHFPELERIEVIGAPTELEGARRLAADEENGRYQFQWWALDQIGATPRGGDKKKGADGGVDGLITFSDVGGELRSVIVSVKSGGVQAKDVRELAHVVERENGCIGVLVTLEEPSRPMREEAAQAGYWHSELYDKDFAKIQIITAKEIIEQKRRPDLPPLLAQQYRKAERVRKADGEQGSLFES
jgi:site-specific DNA-methyltransferase (adenine-specific)